MSNLILFSCSLHFALHNPESNVEKNLTIILKKKDCKILGGVLKYKFDCLYIYERLH